MSMEDEEFLKKLRETFKIEAQEHVQAMTSGLLELEKNPDAQGKAEQIEATFRHAHSLKGAARAANFSAIETICESLEDVFAAWKRLGINVSAEGFDVLHRAIDLIGKFVLTDGSWPDDQTGVWTVVQQLNLLTVGESVARAQPEFATSRLRTTEDFISSETHDQSGPIRVTATGAPGISERDDLAETIRVSTGKLDRMLLEAEELLVVKQSAAQRVADLRHFETVFEEWMRHWVKIQAQLRRLRNAPAPPPEDNNDTLSERGKPSVSAGNSTAELMSFLEWNLAYIKSLQAKLRTVGKSAAQDEHTIAKVVDDLLLDSKKLLMLPFSSLSNIFPKLVRDLSRDQGKEADLVLRGSEVEMDKRILEEMKDPLIHLVRNCVDHGIETAEERMRRNKSSRATITIAVEQVNGNKVEILVSDNGVGIDLARVKDSAVERGIISAAEAQQIDDQKALDLIFNSEVSTSSIVTEISGRGLGLAIVREKTGKLGGQVIVESNPEVGTTFRIVLPLMLAMFRGILVRVGDQVFAIPTAYVERVTRIKRADVKAVENQQTILLNGRDISLARLEDILETGPTEAKTKNSSLIPVVILGSGEEQIAFGVGEVLQEEELLVKPLPKPLSRVRNIAGATILASGKVAAILNVADLMKSARKASVTARPAEGAIPMAQGEGRTITILVVEDSVTSRMFLKGILESAGYQVQTAGDGLEALTILRTENIDVVVSDVEMPRMNGFDLTAHIRSDQRLAEKPIILVTALASAEDRERGIEAGANAYIAKRSFDQSNLLDVIRRLA